MVLRTWQQGCIVSYYKFSGVPENRHWLWQQVGSLYNILIVILTMRSLFVIKLFIKIQVYSNRTESTACFEWSKNHK